MGRRELDPLNGGNYARARDTTGVIDEEFLVKNIKLRMLDVGEQRNERRKWIHSFEGVFSFIFVALLSEYDQMLSEDSSKNQLQDALELFKEMLEMRCFEHSATIVFLNKIDLMEKNYMDQKIPLNASELFLDAPKGEPDLDQALKWFKDMSLLQNKTPKRKIYAHFTCATDTKTIGTVMSATSSHILKQNLLGSGFDV